MGVTVMVSTGDGVDGGIGVADTTTDGDDDDEDGDGDLLDSPHQDCVHGECVGCGDGDGDVVGIGVGDRLA